MSGKPAGRLEIPTGDEGDFDPSYDEVEEARQREAEVDRKFLERSKRRKLGADFKYR